MSTYYEYQDVKRMIAHKLMSMEGWTVYGYHADESDSMTDYYCPAYWGGVAEKNGYILCVDVYGAEKPQEIKKYTNAGAVDRSIYEKIAKLEEMRTDRGATEAEEATAKKRIETLKNKLSEQETEAKKYIVSGTIPGHMANPPRMNWHIEKDGVYIAKGNGILKYASIDQYYNYAHYAEDMKEFKAMSREEYKKQLINDYIMKWNDTEEKAARDADYHIETMEKDSKLVDQFEAFINKIDTTCGGMIGEGEAITYKKITVTEYKKENKAIEDETGSIKDGQCFIVKSSAFNSGIYKGLVYRIHKREYNGNIYFDAYKLNGKLTKECYGMASRNNNWTIYEKDGAYYKKFLGWFESGMLAWCHIEEVKTPYEVEKVVKKTVKATEHRQRTTTETTEATEKINVNNYTYNITEDTDTRDNSSIYIVKVAEKLSREEYAEVNKYIKSLGGYYSKFKHGFLFREDPTDIIKADAAEENTTGTQTEPQKAPLEEQKKRIEYDITEDKHTKTGAQIWLVKPMERLNKSDFAEVKRKFATLKGYYSSYKNGFIFNYDPSEALKTG